MGGEFTENYNLFSDGRRAWIFQASDKAGMNFRTLFAAPPQRGEIRPMGGDDWIGSLPSRKRIREEFQPGDLVFLYQAQPEEAVVGLARIASRGYAPRVEDMPEAEGTFFDLDWWMLTAPLPRTDFESDPVLSDMEKKRIHVGTIFRVSETQAGRLLELMPLNARQRTQVEREWRLPVGSGMQAMPRPNSSREGGREEDSEVRRVIEAYSMRIAQEHYESLQYEVENTAATESFDLKCRKGEEEVRVEVKGTRGDGRAVELTAAEVENARRRECRTDLFILANITVEPSDACWVAHGGEPRVFTDWVPNDQDLTVTRYRYTPPR
jgi:hypothetical protein